jgi:hypothetical protein
MSNTRFITAKNAICMLTIPGVFPTPQQLDNFAADNIYTTEDVNPTEVVQGVDGQVGFGALPYLTKQKFTVQPNSKVLAIIDAWNTAMKTTGEVILCNMVVTLPSINQKYVCTDGGLTGYHPIPDAKKVLSALTFEITWSDVAPSET